MKNSSPFIIREAVEEEFERIGQLLVNVYSSLKRFPSPTEQPEYYKMLSDIGHIAQKRKGRLLVAVNSEDEKIAGAVVYFGNMRYYGSGGTAGRQKNAAGFRLLGVSPESRGAGLGKKLSEACIDLARVEEVDQLIIHTTDAMKTAWKMYEKLGFKRSEDLDFLQGDLNVYGFKLIL